MKKIKHLLSIVVCFVLSFICVSFSACKNNNENNTKTDDSSVDFNNTQIAIIYFSATNNTKNIANLIKTKVEAEILEIKPVVAYTSSDLNYNNSNSRVSQEHNNRNNKNSEFYRPPFVKNFENLDSYDVIFLGYPIWWGEAPNIVYSFLEEYADSFANKKIIPFCTSASSGIGQSAKNLHSHVSDSAIWLNGCRFSTSTTQENINSWIENLQI